jgi:hypothetical protein
VIVLFGGLIFYFVIPSWSFPSFTLSFRSNPLQPLQNHDLHTPTTSHGAQQKKGW